jgi:glutamate-1-semialdehyde 2,1-aminomutase
MAHLAPDGDAYQAGTLSGNPVAMTAGITTLDLLSSAGVWERLETLGAKLEALLAPVLAEAPFPLRLVRAGSLFWLYFHEGDAPRQAVTLPARFAALFHAMLARGVYLPPSAYEVCFLSASFGERDLQYFADALKESLGVASKVA